MDRLRNGTRRWLRTASRRAEQPGCRAARVARRARRPPRRRRCGGSRLDDRDAQRALLVEALLLQADPQLVGGAVAGQDVAQQAATHAPAHPQLVAVAQQVERHQLLQERAARRRRTPSAAAVRRPRPARARRGPSRGCRGRRCGRRRPRRRRAGRATPLLVRVRRPEARREVGRARRAARRVQRRARACRRGRSACRAAWRPCRSARRRPSPARPAPAAGSAARPCGAASACRSDAGVRGVRRPARCRGAAASSSSVRRRTCSCSMIVVWNRPKSEPCDVGAGLGAVHERLDDLVQADDLGLQRRHVRAGRVGRLAFSHRRPPPGPRAEGDPGQRLIDVHAAELLAVGVEAHGVVAPQDVAHAASRGRSAAISSLRRMQSQASTQLRRADLRPHLRESALQVGDQVDAAGHAQDDAALDGAEEGQAAVGVDLLDGAHVVGAVDEHDDRRRREVARGRARSPATPRMRAYSSAAGSPLISFTTRRDGSASVTTSRSSVGTKCCVLNVLNGRAW